MTEHHAWDLAVDSGSLRFSVDVAGCQGVVTLRVDDDVVPSVGALLPALLLPAMVDGGTLTLPGEYSPRLLRGQQEIQAIQRTWSYEWPFGTPPLREVDVHATARGGGARGGRGIAAFFSGGVDSWSTLQNHPEITDLIFVKGFDLGAHELELAADVEDRLRAVAEETGRRLLVVDTNLREIFDPVTRWETYFGCALAHVALALEPLFSTVYVAGDSDYEVNITMGANPLVDHLWSTEHLLVVHDGGRYSRLERLRRIAEDPLVARSLRVCWENRGGAYNCGSCRKCLMTMVSLELLGVRDRFETFPAELDLAAVAATNLQQAVSVTLWQDILDAARVAGRPDLERPVMEAIAAGKATVGLPSTWRRRRTPAPTATVRIAVVVPVYAQSQFLASAVQSALKQEPDVGTGVVIVDDGCPYPSTHIVASTLRDAAPDRVTYVRQSNQGVSAARNAGTRHALQRWPSVEAVFPLDADNLLSPGTLARLWDVLRSDQKAGWAFATLEHFGLEDGEWAVSDPYTAFKQHFENQSDAGSLIRRAVFDVGVWYDESMRDGHEDWEFFLRASLVGFHGLNAGRCGLRYRRRAASMLHKALTAKASTVSGVRARHRRAFEPRALSRREHHELPRFGLVRADRGDVLLMSCVDRPATSVTLTSYAQAIEASSGGAVAGPGQVPAMSMLASAAVLDWLTTHDLLAGVLFRGQAALRQARVLALHITSSTDAELLYVTSVEAARGVPAALMMRTSTLHQRMRTPATSRFPPDAALEIQVGAAVAAPPSYPGAHEVVDVIAAARLPRGPAAGAVHAPHGQWAERLHLEHEDTTFPWGGDAGVMDVLVLAPRLSTSSSVGDLLRLLRDLRSQRPRVAFHLVLTSDGVLAGASPANLSLFSTVTAMVELERHHATHLVSRMIAGMDVVLNAGSLVGHAAATLLPDAERPVTAALVNGTLAPEEDVSPDVVAARHYDGAIDAYIVDAATAAGRLAGLDVIDDKIVVRDGDCCAADLWETIARCSRRRFGHIDREPQALQA